jgi:hypothetical protein
VLEHRPDVAPGHAGRGRLHRRHVNLVDQVPEEGGLGKDLDVEKRRRRLQGHGPELVEPVQLAGRMNIAGRDAEHPAPGDASDPAADASEHAGRPSPQGVVAQVDRLEQRVEVAGVPGLMAGRDQRQGSGRPGQRAAESRGVARSGRDDDRVEVAFARAKQFFDRPGDGPGAFRVARVDHDDPHRRTRERVAPEMVLERVVILVVGRGHPASAPRHTLALDSWRLAGLWLALAWLVGWLTRVKSQASAPRPRGRPAATGV